MKLIDRWLEKSSRALAKRVSRRHLLAQISGLLVGGAALPVLPIARGQSQPAPPVDPDPNTPEGDPMDCNYWRYCAIDGYLCGGCGGTHNSCPPGTEMSLVTWVGTCRNPADGIDYLVSYNDCCGKSTCNRHFCSRSEGEKPVYFPPKSGHINRCIGTSTNVYHCSTANVIGRTLT